MGRAPAAPLVTWLSLTRAALAVPVMVLVLLPARPDIAYQIAAALFAVAAATDFLDGYLARRWHRTSDFGVFLDTTADKLLVAGVLIALTGAGRVWPWAAAVIIGREIAVLGMKGVTAGAGNIVRPTAMGKAKFCVQVVAIFLAIVRYHARIGPLYLDQWAMITAVIVTVLSAWSYLAVMYGRVFRAQEVPSDPVPVVAGHGHRRQRLHRGGHLGRAGRTRPSGTGTGQAGSVG